MLDILDRPLAILGHPDCWKGIMRRLLSLAGTAIPETCHSCGCPAPGVSAASARSSIRRARRHRLPCSSVQAYVHHTALETSRQCALHLLLCLFPPREQGCTQTELTPNTLTVLFPARKTLRRGEVIKKKCRGGPDDRWQLVKWDAGVKYKHSISQASASNTPQIPP